MFTGSMILFNPQVSDFSELKSFDKISQVFKAGDLKSLV